jgi:orotate phosphoribosyltransferase
VTADDIGGATALLLFEAGAIQVSRDRPFILAAGWASPVYVDCRLLIGEPRLRQQAVRLAAAAVELMVRLDNFDAIAGSETAGIPPGLPTPSMFPFATSVSARSVSAAMRRSKAARSKDYAFCWWTI